MIKSVKQFLKTLNLNNSSTFVVGFSGGYDSMCLLDILHKLSFEYGFNLVALHLNHNWRGAEALAEQKNCEEFCKKNNIELVTEVLPSDIPKTETVAREERQKFFRKYYKKFNADGLFLAHTKSDNTETLLYRIAKGTGVKGLCGIAEHSRLEGCDIYRPLMNFSRNEILDYCNENNLNPNHDSSNDNTDYTRNYIRHEVVTKLKKINKNLDDTVLQLSKIAISEQNIIRDYLEKVRNEITQDGVIQTQKFVELSKDVQNKIIVEFLIAQNIDYDAKKVGEIFDFVQGCSSLPSGKTLSLTKDLWLFVSKEKIYATTKLNSERTFEQIRINRCGEYKFNGKTFEIKKYSSSEKPIFPKDTELKAYVNLPDDFEFTLRTRKDGDKIRPIGLNGTMKLKKLFINKGVEKFLRDDIMLLCKDDEVLWAAGVCLSDRLKVKGLPSHVLLIK